MAGNTGKIGRMMFIALEYIKWFFRSKNKHGVHSPFVYKLLTECLYDKTAYPELKNLKDYISALRNNHNYVAVTDLGAGSKHMKGVTRKFSQIARVAGSSPKRAQLLFRLARYFDCKAMLELGTSVGISSYALSSGAKNGQLTTIEGCENLSLFVKEEFQKENRTNVDILTGEFMNHLPELSKNKYDLIFIDGNHRGKPTYEYFEILKNVLNPGGFIIIDDIHSTPDMKSTWLQIMAKPEVTVSIDTFQWGLVFFHDSQAKEHFNIRL